jgi:hypothetical protein
MYIHIITEIKKPLYFSIHIQIPILNTRISYVFCCRNSLNTTKTRISDTIRREPREILIVIYNIKKQAFCMYQVFYDNIKLFYKVKVVLNTFLDVPASPIFWFLSVGKKGRDIVLYLNVMVFHKCIWIISQFFFHRVIKLKKKCSIYFINNYILVQICVWTKPENLASII